MGLTIHYTLKSKLEDAEQVEQTVHKMRQLALDLPFEEVGEIVDLKGEQCDTEARRKELQNGDEKNESLFWLLIQAGQNVRCPWNKRISRTVNPTRIIAFDTWPGPGSEPANFGLCLYPAEIEWEYKPEDDQRFQAAPKEGFGWHRFSTGTSGTVTASGHHAVHPFARRRSPRCARCRPNWRAGTGVPSARRNTPATRRAAASRTSFAAISPSSPCSTAWRSCPA